MNLQRQPPDAAAPHPQPGQLDRVLSRIDLERWSADELALAVALARKPAWFVGGLGAVPVALRPLVKVDVEPVLAHVQLELSEGSCKLHISSSALDSLVGLLTPAAETTRGLGRSVSLDALEALLVALLSPIDKITVGRAAWKDDVPWGASASLAFGTSSVPVWGDSAGLVALYKAITEASKPSNPALTGPTAEHAATAGSIGVLAEKLFGLATLSSSDVADLEVGGGLILDTQWPGGIVALGRRFARHNEGWGTLSELKRKDQVLLRASHATQALDADGLGYLDGGTDRLELVAGDKVLANGRLVSAIVEEAQVLAFRIEQLL